MNARATMANCAPEVWIVYLKSNAAPNKQGELVNFPAGSVCTVSAEGAIQTVALSAGKSVDDFEAYKIDQRPKGYVLW